MHIHELDLEINFIISIAALAAAEADVKSACCFCMRKAGKMFDIIQTSKAHKDSLDIITGF